MLKKRKTRKSIIFKYFKEFSNSLLYKFLEEEKLLSKFFYDFYMTRKIHLNDYTFKDLIKTMKDSFSRCCEIEGGMKFLIDFNQYSTEDLNWWKVSNRFDDYVKKKKNK